MYACICDFIYICLYMCVYVCMYVWLYTYVCMCSYVCRVVVSYSHAVHRHICLHAWIKSVTDSNESRTYIRKVGFRAVLQPFWWLTFLILNTVPSFLWSIWHNSLYSANLAQSQLSIDEMLDDTFYPTFKTEKTQTYTSKKLSVIRKWQKMMAYTQKLIHTPTCWLCKRDAIYRAMPRCCFLRRFTRPVM
jgi:hypothetical protein